MPGKPLSFQQLLPAFNGNDPVDANAVARFEAASGFHLPEDYVRFLEQVNGGEGFIGPHAYVIFWPLEDLLKMNSDYQVAEYVPGLFLFGSDGGGEAFAFDTNDGSMRVVEVPFVGMDLNAARSLAPTFTSFLEKLFES